MRASTDRPPAASVARGRWLDPALLVALTLAVRLALVLSLADGFFYGEELEKGAAAKALLDRLPVPYHALAYHEYEGGGFVVSHLKALAFLVVGENLLAHKLVALAFSLAIVAAAYALCRRLFGRAGGIAGGLLAALGPPTFQQLSLLSLGIHHEATLFLFLLLFAAVPLLAGKGTGRTWLGLGLAAGFGVYFSYQLAPFAAAVAVALLARRASRERLLGAGGALALAGTAVGAAPLALMAAAVGRRVLDVHGTALSGEAREPASLLFREFLRSIYVDGALGSTTAAALWPAATVLAALALLGARGPGARRGPALGIAGLLVLWHVVYLVSPFVVGEVYHPFLVMRWAPAAALATVLVAGAIGRGLTSEGLPRVAAAVGLALLLAHGARGAWRLARDGPDLPLEARASWLVHTSGVEYLQYFDKVLPDFPGDEEAKLRAATGFDEPHRERLLADAACALFTDPGRDPLPRALERARGVLARVLGPEAPLAELGLGRLLVQGSGWDPARALGALARLSPGEAERLAEAVGRFGSGRHPQPEVLRAELRATADDPLAHAYARGLGRRLLLGTRPHAARAEAFLASLDAATAAAVRAGYERARDLRRR